MRPDPTTCRMGFGSPRRLALATTVAMVLAGHLAWGHTFPPVRSVVVQVERCEVAVLVGYRFGSGTPTETLLRKTASSVKSQLLESLREHMTKQALAALTFAVDGIRLVPTTVRAKVALETGQTQPSVVVLVTFPLPAGKALAVSTTEPRITRISWADRQSGRVVISESPTQGKWYTAVASFLLNLVPNSGGSACSIAPSSLVSPLSP